MFDKFAIKHGLQYSFRYELTITKEEFESTIFDFVREESFGPMLSSLWSYKGLFYGNFEFEKFVLKKRRAMGEFSLPIARCNYSEQEGVLIVEGDIHGLRTRYALMAILLLPLYSLFLVLAFAGKLQSPEMSWLYSIIGTLILVSAHVFGFFIRPFYKAKKSVALMKEELDRIFGSENSLGQNIILRISLNELNQIFEKKISCKDLVFTQGSGLGRRFNVEVSDDLQEIHYPGEKSDESLDAKAKSINELGGWVHFKNGTSYQLRNGIIAQIKLRGKAVSRISSISIQQTIDSYGLPEEKSSEMSAGFFGLDIESVIFSYKSKGLRFYFDPESKLLNELWLSYD